ncbi:GlxA family transcriptional regulator [Roseovarius sp. CH_XMU1461]|jgi:transcriptional regulator GlxA family with amidase domain|uniref:GlxA family transcriptional regulator n=1 Tax=Roseovarius sp. CH_XMU1461 TaxID=3107777 RepID=UPI003009B49D
MQDADPMSRRDISPTTPAKDYWAMHFDRGGQGPARFVFLLLDNFSHLSLTTALEALRQANKVLKFQQFSWALCGEGGVSKQSSLGFSAALDMGLEDLRPGDTLVVVGGVEVDAGSTDAVLAYLRRMARRGLPVGGLCTAAHTLAKAGLMDDRRATIHWENSESFAEIFDTVPLCDEFYVLEDGYFTTAGGTTAIDLMLALFTRALGGEVATGVAANMNYTNIHAIQRETRMTAAERESVRHPVVVKALNVMEREIEMPPTPSEIAEEVGISTRQLERLFKHHLGRSPKRYYNEFRVQKAYRLILQTDLTVIEIAMACGFSSASHFSKVFRQIHNCSPLSLRRERGAEGHLMAQMTGYRV